MRPEADVLREYIDRHPRLFVIERRWLHWIGPTLGEMVL